MSTAAGSIRCRCLWGWSTSATRGHWDHGQWASCPIESHMGMSTFAVPGFMDVRFNVEALLASVCLCPQAPSELLLLMPDSLLQRALVPSGHLQEVSTRCRVKIDLRREVAPSHREVVLTGTAAATSAAAFWIQVGA